MNWLRSFGHLILAFLSVESLNGFHVHSAVEKTFRDKKNTSTFIKFAYESVLAISGMSTANVL